MRVALAADHAGLPLKKHIQAHLNERHMVVDLGGDGSDVEDDYPDYARLVGEAIGSGQADVGILVCGSGVGVTVAANKIRGIRACLCHDPFTARQGRQDDDMNVLCLGAWVIGPALALHIVDVWLNASFSRAERHRRRLAKIDALEQVAPTQGRER